MSQGLTPGHCPRSTWPGYAGAVSSTAETAASASRESVWWRRTVGVLRAPTPVFAGIRDDDSQEDLDARQEPLTAIVFLAAIAAVLATPTRGHLLDDPVLDGLVIPVLAIFTGGIYAAFGYFILGGAAYLGARAAGSFGSYRRARHIFGFALVPVALSLLMLWPVRLALYGGDSFRTAGSDSPTGDRVFDLLQLAFVLWSVALLVLGFRIVERWSWGRAVAALAAAIAVIAALVAVFRLG